ncbi:MAG: TetR/AcrR family transcriptional regulator [Anaerolineales bacterium]
MDSQQPSSRPRFERRRRRRIRRRQEEILSAAAEVFAEKGYANTTVREIAERADMAEGTLYNYFDGKREILLTILEEAQPPLEEAFTELEGLEDRDAMMAMIEQAFDLSEVNLPFTRTLLTEAWVDDEVLQDFIAERIRNVDKLLQAFVRERIRAGAFRSIDPAIASRVSMGMFLGLLLPVLRGVEPVPSPAERRQLAAAAVDLLLEGIRRRPAEGGG